MAETGDQNFRDKMAEWRGYVLRALEDIDGDLKRIYEHQEKREKAELERQKIVDQRIEETNKRITNLYIKVATIVGGITVVAYIFGGWIKTLVMKILGGG